MSDSSTATIVTLADIAARIEASEPIVVLPTTEITTVEAAAKVALSDKTTVTPSRWFAGNPLGWVCSRLFRSNAIVGTTYPVGVSPILVFAGRRRR